MGKIFRFYLKCTRCSGEFTIKTDPKNACETGVSRNFEPWQERDQAIEEMKAQRDKEEEGDAMKALENRNPSIQKLKWTSWMRSMKLNR